MEKKQRVPKGELYWYVHIGLVRISVVYAIDFRDEAAEYRWMRDNYFTTQREAETVAKKIKAVLAGADVIEMPSYENEVIASEEIYHQKEYDKGEYCHKQSFIWGFQEGIDFLQSKIVK